jgi:hypothetical protein
MERAREREREKSPNSPGATISVPIKVLYESKKVLCFSQLTEQVCDVAWPWHT